VHAAPATPIGAIHVEVDQNIPPVLCRCIVDLYAHTATTFPLGIKMSLMTELHLTSTPTVQTNAAQFQTMQANFLAKTETQKVNVWPNTIYNPQQAYAIF